MVNFYKMYAKIGLNVQTIITIHLSFKDFNIWLIMLMMLLWFIFTVIEESNFVFIVRIWTTFLIIYSIISIVVYIFLTINNIAFISGILISLSYLSYGIKTIKKMI